VSHSAGGPSPDDDAEILKRRECSLYLPLALPDVPDVLCDGLNRGVAAPLIVRVPPQLVERGVSQSAPLDLGQSSTPRPLGVLAAHLVPLCHELVEGDVGGLLGALK